MSNDFCIAISAPRGRGKHSLAVPREREVRRSGGTRSTFTRSRLTSRSHLVAVWIPPSYSSSHKHCRTAAISLSCA